MTAIPSGPPDPPRHDRRGRLRDGVGCTRVDHEIITERDADVDRQPDRRVVHLLGPDCPRQHDLALLPRRHDRVRSRQGMGADRTQDDLLGPRDARGCLSRRRRPRLDLTDDTDVPPASKARAANGKLNRGGFMVSSPPGRGGHKSTRSLALS